VLIIALQAGGAGGIAHSAHYQPSKRHNSYPPRMIMTPHGWPHLALEGRVLIHKRTVNRTRDGSDGCAKQGLGCVADGVARAWGFFFVGFGVFFRHLTVRGRSSIPSASNAQQLVVSRSSKNARTGRRGACVGVGPQQMNRPLLFALIATAPKSSQNLASRATTLFDLLQQRPPGHASAKMPNHSRLASWWVHQSHLC
jgi:hypothetical protein